MAQLSRKAQADCLRYFLKVLHFPGISNANNGRSETASIDQLIEVLVNVGKYSNVALAKETVLNALSDGLLVPTGNKTTKSSKNTSNSGSEERVRLPREQEIKGSSHDFYCFECHLPGILESCRQCTRSFHRLCYRKNPERPNYVVPSSKIQKNPLPTFSSASDTDSDENETLHSSLVLGYESDMRTSSQLIQANQHSMNTTPHQYDSNKSSNKSSRVENSTNGENIQNKSENTNKVNLMLEDKSILENLENEVKCPIDVVCLGEVRPPQRKRPVAAATSNVSYKSEAFPSDDDDSDLELCTCCRLIKCADLQNPPNVQADELCFLINYTFLRNKNWMQHDVATYLENLKISSKEMNILTRLLFVPSLKRLTDIVNNIRQKAYELLMGFLVDLLDIQHAVGIFFGPNSTEMEATKWLLRDVTYDLSEIRRCPDCFRYSHETSSSVWFAKPCVQRHELVFAKHSGFPYWPAKVIRVLPNNKYDVRFFGGNHSRALIDVRHIKAIDTDLRSLKLGNSSAMKKALQELHYHQMLSTYSPSIFSFHADSKETEQVIQNVLNHTSNTEVLALHCKPKRRGRPKMTKTDSIITLIDGNTPSNSNNNENNNNNDVNSTNIANYYCGITANTKKSKYRNNNNNNINNMHNKNNNNNSSRNHSNKKRLRRMFNPTIRVKRVKLSNYVNDVDIFDKTSRNTRRKKAINADDSVETVKILLKEVDDAHKKVKDFKAKNEKLQAQKLKLKTIIKKLESERRILKRKQWCYWCLEEAIFLCCFRAAYCSEVCQKRHWQDSHSRVCKNPSSIRPSHQTPVQLK